MCLYCKQEDTPQRRKLSLSTSNSLPPVAPAAEVPSIKSASLADSAQKDVKRTSSSSGPVEKPFPYNISPISLFYPLMFPAPAKTGGIPLRYPIDALKGLTLPFCLLCMYSFNAWKNPAALIYTAIHGLYGILWVTKSIMFPDSRWETPMPEWHAALAGTMLAGYWIGPFNLMRTGKTASPVLLAFAVAMFGLGVFLHFASDLQKTIVLEYRKKNPVSKVGPGLIKDKFFAYVRNPNYLGELLIYGSFITITRDFSAFLLMFTIVSMYWVPNMVTKERSLSRYPEFEAYRKRSWFWVPFIW